MASRGTFISAVFIFNKSGIPLVAQNYSNLKIDPVLISGFFNALMTLSEEWKLGEMKKISFENKHFVLLRGNNIDIVVITGNAKIVDYITNSLTVLENRFYDKYAEIGYQNQDVKVYAEFKKEIDKYVSELYELAKYIPL